jgi:PmbA protein
LLDLMRYAIRQAEALGAGDCEVYAAASSESEVFIENNDVKQAKSQKTSSMGIRVLLGGSVGFYSINSLTKDRIKDAVATAVKIARASPPDRFHALPGKSKPKPLRGIYDKKAESFYASQNPTTLA